MNPADNQRFSQPLALSWRAQPNFTQLYRITREVHRQRLRVVFCQRKRRNPCQYSGLRLPRRELSATTRAPASVTFCRNIA